MIHLTLSGYHEGRPLCDCDKDNAKANGDTFEHAEYWHDDGSGEVCVACLKVWRYEDGDEETGYKLMYDTGGLGGPYWGLDKARDAAKTQLAGCRRINAVYIVPSDRISRQEDAIEVVKR